MLGGNVILCHDCLTPFCDILRHFWAFFRVKSRIVTFFRDNTSSSTGPVTKCHKSWRGQLPLITGMYHVPRGLACHELSRKLGVLVPPYVGNLSRCAPWRLSRFVTSSANTIELPGPVILCHDARCYNPLQVNRRSVSPDGYEVLNRRSKRRTETVHPKMSSHEV